MKIDIFLRLNLEHWTSKGGEGASGSMMTKKIITFTFEDGWYQP